MEELIESVVYSGSFNPFHIGHLEIVKFLSKCFDKVYVVVTVQNPFKTTGIDNFNERLENVKRIVEKEKLTNVVVEDIEKNITPPYYTVKTLDALTLKYPFDLLSLCVGGDCLESFDKWYKWETILNSYGLVIMPRKGYDTKPAIENLKKIGEEPQYWHISVLDVNIPEISSSEIREKLKKGEDVSNLLP